VGMAGGAMILLTVPALFWFTYVYRYKGRD
jgi:hypothetical protein